MITIQQLTDLSSVHSLGEGRQIRITDGKIIASIVGGRYGLYGDFVDTFELALMDYENNQFITKKYFPLNDDVIGWMSKTDLETFLNEIFTDGFQVL